MKSYLWNVAKALTQLFNALTGGNEDQSFSGRTGIAFLLNKRWAKIVKPLIDWVFNKIKGEKDHCENSIEWDEVDSQVMDDIWNEDMNEVILKCKKCGTEFKIITSIETRWDYFTEGE